jgi:polysaccharide biosynthesis transport protein
MVLLLITPVIMASLVYYLTRKPTLIYSSETTLYTGIASGTSVEMDKSLSFFATNTAFDNLINVIKSRETQQDVAIRLLAQHLMMERYDPKFISKNSFLALRKITPSYIEKLVVRKPDFLKKSERNKPESNAITALDKSKMNANGTGHKNTLNDSNPSDTSLMDTALIEKDFSFSSLDSSSIGETLPVYLDKEAYEQTVQNLKDYMSKSDTNFVYKLLYYHHPHYSLSAISKVTVKRIGNSDLVKLTYESGDPGICKQTLALFTEVCIRNYKNIKENRSDAIVKYFEYQVKQSAVRLRLGEDKLLKFNEDHNIINYYEQSKAVAIVKENLDVSYHDMRIKLAGTIASIRRIEEKLGNQKEIQLNNASIVEKRNQLAEINSKISQIETISTTRETDTINNQSLVKLKFKAENLKEELKQAVISLYNYNNTVEGLHISTLLNDWIKNVIQYEDIKAGIEVLGQRIIEFQKQYAIYAPAGANIKRIEREINVSEQEFLELLHGLNLAKLKVQDAELSASIKAVDPPFFPLSPNPTKRSLLIMVAAVFGFIIVLGIIIAMEFFDSTMKNPKKAAGVLKLQSLGIFPKIFLKTGTLNFPFIANRLLEIIIQQIGLLPDAKEDTHKTIIFFSTLSNEGKTILSGNIAQKLKKQGKRILVLNYSRESLRHMEVTQIGYSEEVPENTTTKKIKRIKRAPFFSRILGYPDTRVDYDSAFLENPDKYLDPEDHSYYNIDSAYFSAKSYKELLQENQLLNKPKPDYVLIEIPNLLSYPYPIDLIKSAALSVLVCRANHVWSEADKSALENIMKLTPGEPKFLLNGVDIPVIETILGDLPKKRSRLRRILKKVVRFQFFSGYQP